MANGLRNAGDALDSQPNAPAHEPATIGRKELRAGVVMQRSDARTPGQSPRERRDLPSASGPTVRHVKRKFPARRENRIHLSTEAEDREMSVVPDPNALNFLWHGGIEPARPNARDGYLAAAALQSGEKIS